MEFYRGWTMLQLRLITQIACLDIDTNLSRHSWPPIILRYHFEGLEVACMSSNMCIVMLLHNLTPEISVFRDIYLASEYE
jgi:hypothetical protein